MSTFQPWPELEARSTWHPARNPCYAMKYHQTIVDGVPFADWRRIPYCDIKRYDILKLFFSSGFQIGLDGGITDDPSICFVAMVDAERAPESGYQITRSACLTFDELSPNIPEIMEARETGLELP